MSTRVPAAADAAEPDSDAQRRLHCEPDPSQWLNLLKHRPEGAIAQRALTDWRETTRRELGLPTDRLVIATGHQALLWHPGILAKYIAVDAFAAAHNLATANVIVDQHADGFGHFDVPVRNADGALAVQRLELCRPRPGVPMVLHEAFDPLPPPDWAAAPGAHHPRRPALHSVREGIVRIFDAVRAQRGDSNAAMQMARALADLMRAWVRPMPDISASDLMPTSLARVLLQLMVEDAQRCAECYNRAVALVPEAGIAPLLVRDDYVELPLWRVGPDGRRMRAYDNDVEAALARESKILHDAKRQATPKLPLDSGGRLESRIQNPETKIDLLPRALFMTALIRLGVCDLFVHGTGGGVYDRTMELWVRDWLGVEVAPLAIVSATLRLPLLGNDASASPPDVPAATAALRRLWHDPASLQPDWINDATFPSAAKRALLASIASHPRGSPQRRRAFHNMHEQLAALREHNVAAAIASAQETLEQAKRRAADAVIASRRDWAFPVYPREMIDDLAREIAATIQGSAP